MAFYAVENQGLDFYVLSSASNSWCEEAIG